MRRILIFYRYKKGRFGDDAGAHIRERDKLVIRGRKIALEGEKQEIIDLSLVAHTGFEPVISSLRGRCPRPLDECATHTYSNKNCKKFTTSKANCSQRSCWRSLSYPNYKGQAIGAFRDIIIH